MASLFLFSPQPVQPRKEQDESFGHPRSQGEPVLESWGRPDPLPPPDAVGWGPGGAGAAPAAPPPAGPCCCGRDGPSGLLHSHRQGCGIAAKSACCPPLPKKRSHRPLRERPKKGLSLQHLVCFGCRVAKMHLNWTRVTGRTHPRCWITCRLCGSSVPGGFPKQGSLFCMNSSGEQRAAAKHCVTQTLDLQAWCNEMNCVYSQFNTQSLLRLSNSIPPPKWSEITR